MSFHLLKGKIPKNEYGNVELFQPWMLPVGSVHLQDCKLFLLILTKRKKSNLVKKCHVPNGWVALDIFKSRQDNIVSISYYMVVLLILLITPISYTEIYSLAFAIVFFFSNTKSYIAYIVITMQWKVSIKLQRSLTSTVCLPWLGGTRNMDSVYLCMYHTSAVMGTLFPTPVPAHPLPAGTRVPV